jgi:hypothetical protein
MKIKTRLKLNILAIEQDVHQLVRKSNSGVINIDQSVNQHRAKYALPFSLLRFRCPAAWHPASFARPCERLIPALFVCLLQSLHKIALQSSARSLRPFSKSPSTMPLSTVRFSEFSSPLDKLNI